MTWPLSIPFRVPIGMFQHLVLAHGIRGWSIQPRDRHEALYSYRYLAEQVLRANGYEPTPGHFDLLWQKKEIPVNIDLKAILIDIVEKGVFPIIDDYCKSWHTPLELDDKAWDFIKQRITEWLHDPARVSDTSSGAVYQVGNLDHYNMPALGLSSVSWQELIQAFVEKVVFPIVDDYVRSNHTVLEWDDKVWERLKPRILEYIGKIQLQSQMHYSYSVNG